MIEAMKQALEALETPKPLDDYPPILNAYAKTINNAITSLRQAIREHAMYEVQRLGQEIEQEPVAWMSEDEHTVYTSKQVDGCFQHDHIPLYTHPPQRTWVGLTKDEVDSWNLPDHPTVFEFAQFIEAKLKEKNT